MVDPKGVPVQFSGIGDNDRVPYVKIDFAKCAQVSDNIAIGFYQIDYQALANFLGELSKVEPKLMPAVKIVMTLSSFEQLRTELNEIAGKLQPPIPAAAGKFR